MILREIKMSQTTSVAAEKPAPEPPPARNAAVERCCQARLRSLKNSREKHHDSYDTEVSAEEAYRNALPDLAGYENIRDFIACVTHGMVIGVIDSIDGPKLLYAAQVAIGALRCTPKSQEPPAA